MIHGVEIIPLKKIPDPRGLVMHMLRRDDSHFLGFGEVYFSVVYPGKIKGWHLHTLMTLNYALVVGRIRLVLYDDRPESPTRAQLQELTLGEENYSLIQIPPFIWNAFQGLAECPSIVANCSTHPHDPTEIQRMDPHQNPIPYRWETGTWKAPFEKP